MKPIVEHILSLPRSLGRELLAALDGHDRSPLRAAFENGDVWNFAYGSNLHPAKLQSRADLRPRESVAGVLRGWRLAFNLASIPVVEPRMASVVPDPGDEVHGVLLRLSGSQFERLVSSEGGSLFYAVEAVVVESYDGREIEAFTFRSLPRLVRPEAPPSKRYLDLIREGARHHALDPVWVERLETWPDAGPPGRAGRWVKHFFSQLERPENRRWRGPVLRVIATLLVLDGTLRQL